MIELRQSQVTLGSFRLNVSAQVAGGTRVALLGASGSGKSTLLSLIAGFLTPDAGKVWLAGQDATAMPPARRPVSILFQDGNLFPHLTVSDNVALGLRPDLRLSEAQRQTVTDVLDDIGLGPMADRRPRDLSGGQQSRVAVARMLLRDRPIALLDEPFAALDPGLRAEVLELVDAKARARGLTIIMASHDLRDAERLCDRLWLLEAGQIVLDVPMAGLRTDPPPALAAWL